MQFIDKAKIRVEAEKGMMGQLRLDVKLMYLKDVQLVVMVEKAVVLFLKLQHHFQLFWI